VRDMIESAAGDERYAREDDASPGAQHAKRMRCAPANAALFRICRRHARVCASLYGKSANTALRACAAPPR